MDYKPDLDKPTILIVTEDATLHSGLARVTRSIFEQLHKLNKYNILQLGWAGPGREVVPWPVMHAERGSNGQTAEHDRYGKATFPRVIDEHRPDIVWGFGDPWMLDHLGKSEYRSRYHLVIYTCIDSEPLSQRFRGIYESANVRVTFGKWPRDVLHDSYGLDSEVIPHGVSTDIFIPDPLKRERFRLEMGVRDPRKILMGTIARNQPRKNLAMMFPILHALRNGRYSTCKECAKVTADLLNPATMAVRKKADTCKYCGSSNMESGVPDDRWLWYYHGALVDIQGWDIPELTHRYHLQDGSVLTNAYVQPLYGNLDQDLIGVYNALDAFVLPTICEGFGLPLAEAMSCGIPVVAPGYSAYMDWAPAGGLMVDTNMFIDHGTHAQRAHGILDHWLEQLLKLTDPIYRHTLGKAGREKMVAEYNWKDITGLWERLFDETFVKKSGASNWRKATRI